MVYPQTQKRNTNRFADPGNPLLMLIFVNVIVFIIFKFIDIVYVLSDSSSAQFQAQIMQWFYLPAKLNMFITRPWVLLTHMITETSVWGLIGNMIFLWVFGYIFQDLTGNRQVVPVYIYGALAGAVLFVAGANAFPQFRAAVNEFNLLGAGPAVMAIALAATVTAPDYRLFPMLLGGIPLWVVTLIYVLIDFAGLASRGFPFHLAQLGGALAGFLYVRQIKAGNDPGNWMHRFYYWITHLFDPSRRKLKPVTKQQVFYNTKGKPPYSKTPSVNEKRVDAILDKISAQGYSSLTAEEREILKKASENEQ